MASLLLAVIYVAFISLGLPDSLLGSAWPTMSQDLNVPVAWAGGISAVISMFTIVSALLSDRMTLKFGAGKVTAVSVALTAAALAGFSVTSNYWVLLAIAIPYGLGAGGVDAALNNYVAIHYESRHMAGCTACGASAHRSAPTSWAMRSLKAKVGRGAIGTSRSCR